MPKISKAIEIPRLEIPRLGFARAVSSLSFLGVSVLLLLACTDGSKEIPDLVGDWQGLNQTVSELKGFREWEKTVHITEQRDRRFRGYFEYSEGRKDFFGVIHHDNDHFTWVASDSKGYNFGYIHDRGRKISACYVEAWKEATAGCAVLSRMEPAT